ncbi:MAG: hypothetical protein M3P49_06020 [Actinomycetota bacterium]|nr:hypothetical protein [Actinomycetota bacterium]
MGERAYKVRVGYVYDAVYMDPALVSSSFASLSGSPMTGDTSTRQFTVWQDSQGNVTAPQDARKTQGMGGWGLDVLHRYDPESRTLMLGTGEERVGAKDVDNVVKAAAGGGAQVFFGGDGGPAADVQMYQPRGVAAGPDGSFYVADTSNQRIRKVASDGTITTIAGNGGYASYWAPRDDGKPAKDVPLSSPEHFVVAPDGSIYYTDSSKPRVRKIGPDGIVKTVAGTGTSGFTGDGGPAAQAQLQSPSGIALAPDGSLFIRENYRIRKVAPDGNINTVAGTGTSGFAGDGGPAAQAQIGYGTSLAVDRDGNLYVSDPGYYRVRKVATDGNISTVAGNGSYPYSYQSNGDGGAATQARVYPQNIAVGPDGSLYVNDSGNRVRKIGPDGNIATVAGGASTGTYDDGVPATKASLSSISGLAIAPDRGVYIADPQNHSVRRVNAEGVIDTVAGSLNAGDGAAARAYLSNPDGVAAAPDGSFFIADAENNRVRKLAPDGTVSTIAGTGRRGFSGDGGPAAKAKLNRPSSVVVAADGTVYFADTGNHRVRKVDPSGLLTTVTGDGTQGFAGDGGPAAQARLSSPSGVALDAAGVLYVSDTANNRIRRIGIDGIITTVAGKDTGASPGIGGLTADAKLNQPRGMASGSDGSVYFADSSGSRVFKIGSDGVLSVAAGTGTSGYYGDTGPAAQAQLSGVAGLATGPDGSLYINDSGNGRIRRVESDGTILSVAGGGASSWADNVAGTDARISGRGIAVAPDGGLYVADQNRIRKVGSFLTGNSPGNLTIPSEDGSELYAFTSRGQHLRTLDSVTGKVLYEFSYDEGKRLVGVKDADGLTTKVERDVSGNPSAIVAPNGERTALSTNADGYLTSISNPAGESIDLSYSRGGLLSSFSKPKGNTSRFTYDEMGRLTKDEDAAGGFKALSKRSTAKLDFSHSGSRER